MFRLEIISLNQLAISLILHPSLQTGSDDDVRGEPEDFMVMPAGASHSDVVKDDGSIYK